MFSSLSQFFFKNTLSGAGECILEITACWRFRVLKEFNASLPYVRLCLKNKVTKPQILSLNLITVLFIGPALILIPSVSSGFCLDCFLSVFYDYFFSRISYFLARSLWESSMFYSSRWTVPSFFVFCCLFSVLGIDPRAFSMLVKHPIPKYSSNPLYFVFSN